MSIDIMNRLWHHDFDQEVAKLDVEKYPGSAKNLFWALLPMADMSGDEGFCWPAVETIAKRSRLSRRAVQMALAQAEVLGILKRRQRRDASTQYVFVLNRIPHVERQQRAKERGPIDWFEEPEEDLFGGGACGAPLDPARVKGVHGGGAGDSRTGAPHAPRTTNETPVETPSLTDEEISNAFLDRWTKLAEIEPNIKPVGRFSEDRAKELRARLGSRKTDHVAETLDMVFERIAGSRWLRGRDRKSNGWCVSYGWVLKKMNFTKITEGFYVQDFDSQNPDAGGNSSDRSHGQAGRDAARIIDAMHGDA